MAKPKNQLILSNTTRIDNRTVNTPSTLISTVDQRVLEENITELFKPENIKRIVGDVTDNSKTTKKREGRPNVKEKYNTKYSTSKIKEVLDDNRQQRVIPIYDGFDPLTGGLTLLTPIEHAFAIAFAQTGNSTRAAELSCLNSTDKNNKSRNWRKVGSDLFKRPHVQQAIGYMQKKICVAAALDASEVISNIREIGALAMTNEKYDAALKANQMLGEYLGIFGKTKEERLKNVTNSTTIEVFKTGEELIDNKNDINRLSSSLGIDFKG